MSRATPQGAPRAHRPKVLHPGRCPHGPGQVTGQPRVPQELRPQLSWDQPPAEPRLPEPPPSSRRRNWLQTLPDRSRRAHRRRADRDAPRVRAGSDPTRPRSSTAAPQGPRRAVLVPGAALPGRAAHRCKLRRSFRFRSLSTPRGHGKVTLWTVVMASTGQPLSASKDHGKAEPLEALSSLWRCCREVVNYQKQFEMEFCTVTQAGVKWQSQLTATSASRVRAILPPQPPE
ncbi:uncharacterized protein LOC114674304 [Macaca mulatta]